METNRNHQITKEQMEQIKAIGTIEVAPDAVDFSINGVVCDGERIAVWPWPVPRSETDKTTVGWLIERRV